MNKLNTAKRAQIIGMLVEGNSMRAVSRMADCSLPSCLLTLERLALNINLKLFATCLAKLSNVMKYGHSVIQKKRTCQKAVKASLGSVMFIRGRRFALILNLFRLPWSVSVMQHTATLSCLILRAGF